MTTPSLVATSAVRQQEDSSTMNLSLLQFNAWSRMDFADKIRIIRSGLPAQRLSELAKIMGIPSNVLIGMLGLSLATVNYKVKQKLPLSPEETERLIGLESLLSQVEAMADNASVPQFNAAQWLASWLTASLPALGNATPGSFMDTMEGQKHVSNLLEMAQSGAYA